MVRERIKNSMQNFPKDQCTVIGDLIDITLVNAFEKEDKE